MPNVTHDVSNYCMVIVGCHLVWFSASGEFGICVHTSLHLERCLLVMSNGLKWVCLKVWYSILIAIEWGI